MTIYAKVPDVQAFLDKAQSLGGSAVMRATMVGESLEFAALADPQGNPFGLYRTIS